MSSAYIAIKFNKATHAQTDKKQENNDSLRFDRFPNSKSSEMLIIFLFLSVCLCGLLTLLKAIYAENLNNMLSRLN